ncbi:hypothetical protein [Chamaesiphon sp. OTE_75_metabat_556]|uniref:hypothetical protein n=1 Tax=Chamaesiphon sp. OTE_75_metabat_556 TaxID=2964692 RepID=UPI00286CBB00|nr:hypothetical protein [Chamaesiphon sp. OTE_75_metabat_556]
MKIQASQLGYRVIEPFSDLGEFHISSEVIDNLANNLGAASLEDMMFNTSLADLIWEISAPTPIGTGKAIASVTPSIIGRLQQQDDGIILCSNY